MLLRLTPLAMTASKATVAAFAIVMCGSAQALSMSSSTQSGVPGIGSPPSYIAGRRAIVCPRSGGGGGTGTGTSSQAPPPLVLIGGTAQTIPSWDHHVVSLSRTRDVLVYECLGQGPLPPFEIGDSYFEDVSLNVQGMNFASVVCEAFHGSGSSEGSAEGESSVTSSSTSAPSDAGGGGGGGFRVDVAGFSFGGRVAMAAAATHPGLIRKLHLTGVPAGRGPYSRLILSSWEDILRSSLSQRGAGAADLTAFAWSSLLATHSPEFLSKNERRARQWVEHMCGTNTAEGLLAIIDQTHTEDEDDAWHPIAMAERIASTGSVIGGGRLAVGSDDKLASVEEVERLSGMLGWGDIDVYDGCGHAVVIENARQWRSDLLAFLDEEPTGKTPE